MIISVQCETEFIPTYQSEGAAGADLRADIKGVIHLVPGKRVAIPTGVKMAIPEGYYGQVEDRSGWAAKWGITALAGVIDSDYRGEIQVILHNTGDETIAIWPGERIAQIIIKPVIKAGFMLVNDLEGTERGDGGFGSTGY